MIPTGTEMLNPEHGEFHRGWVCYDAACPLCRRAAARFAPLLNRYHFQFVSLQTAWVQDCLGLKPNEPLTEMKLIRNDGRIFGGADALVQIARSIWWTWPAFAFAKIPGAMRLLRAIYRSIAEKRTCFSGKCSIPKTLS